MNGDRFRTVLVIVSVVLLNSLLFPRRAQAYLDPGTGSMLWQVLVASLLAVSYVVGKYWKVIRRWFARSSDVKPRDEKSS